MKKIMLESLELFSVFVLLFAYALISFSVIDSSHPTFLLCNIMGAIGIILISYEKKLVQPIVLNVIWGIIALIGVLSLIQ